MVKKVWHATWNFVDLLDTSLEIQITELKSNSSEVLTFTFSNFVFI